MCSRRSVTLLIDYAGQDVQNAVVRFTATWCVPCKHYGPVFDMVAERLDAEFYVVDIETSPELAAEHGVMSIPVVFRVKDGVWEKYPAPPTAPELRDAALSLTG